MTTRLYSSEKNSRWVTIIRLTNRTIEQVAFITENEARDWADHETNRIGVESVEVDFIPNFIRRRVTRVFL